MNKIKKVVGKEEFTKSFYKTFIPSFFVFISYFAFEDFLYDYLNFSIFIVVHIALFLSVLFFIYKTMVIEDLRFKSFYKDSSSMSIFLLRAVPYLITPYYLVYEFCYFLKDESLSHKSYLKHIFKGLLVALFLQLVVSFALSTFLSTKRSFISGLGPSLGYISKVVLDVQTILDRKKEISASTKCDLYTTCYMSFFFKHSEKEGISSSAKLLHYASIFDLIQEDRKMKRISKAKSIELLLTNGLIILNTKELSPHQITFGIHFFNITTVVELLLLDILDSYSIANFDKKVIIKLEDIASKAFIKIEEGKLSDNKEDQKELYSKRIQILKQLKETKDKAIYKKINSIFAKELI